MKIFEKKKVYRVGFWICIAICPVCVGLVVLQVMSATSFHEFMSAAYNSIDLVGLAVCSVLLSAVIMGKEVALEKPAEYNQNTVITKINNKSDSGVCDE